MPKSINTQNTESSKLVFGISVFVLLLIIVFRSIDIYKYAFVGAVFEMLWLFIFAAIFIIPFFAVWRLFKDSFSFKSLYFFTILVSVISLIIFFY